MQKIINSISNEKIFSYERKKEEEGRRFRC